MSVDDEHILHKQQRDKSFPSAPEVALTLSEKQLSFLRHAIHDIRAGPIIDAEIAERVKAVRYRALEAFPYPCIRYFNYVSLGVSEHQAFAHVIEAGRSADPPILLDIGCCMGTDLRYFVHSGYQPASLIGCDLEGAFIDLGYELYGDRDTCLTSFISGDIFKLPLLSASLNGSASAERAVGKLDTNMRLKDVKGLADLRGRVRYIYAGALFHLFDEATQEALAKRIAALLEPAGPALVFGRHVASAEEGIIEDIRGDRSHAHSPASWERLWQRILGDARPVRVDAFVTSAPTLEWSSNAQRMTWSVWIG